MVNWCEMIVTDSSSDKILYQNRLITNHEINESNVSKIAKGGRTRWKVENEGFNTLKKHGYNLEHNFGHGQQNLCEILLSLNLWEFILTEDDDLLAVNSS